MTTRPDPLARLLSLGAADRDPVRRAELALVAAELLHRELVLQQAAALVAGLAEVEQSLDRLVG